MPFSDIDVFVGFDTTNTPLCEMCLHMNRMRGVPSFEKHKRAQGVVNPYYLVPLESLDVLFTM